MRMPASIPRKNGESAPHCALPKGMTGPRDAQTIMQSMFDRSMRSEASRYFGCFRFAKSGQPCRSCKLVRLAMRSHGKRGLQIG